MNKKGLYSKNRYHNRMETRRKRYDL